MPFVATPDPQLPAWDSTTITVTETTGTVSEVQAPTLRFLSDPGLTLDNGQSVLFRRVSHVEASPVASGNIQLTVTLVNGKEVTGTIDPHISIDGDTASGPLSTETSKLASIQVNRGGATGS